MILSSVNKTDRQDAREMNLLQQNGTLPTVWIPPGHLRDQRELFRTSVWVTYGGNFQITNGLIITIVSLVMNLEELVKEVFLHFLKAWVFVRMRLLASVFSSLESR